MEKDVYFVRHGESESNADGIHRGKEAPLNDKGREQAAIVAERIERIGVDTLMSSTYPRARDTAAIIDERIDLSAEESELFGERRRPSASIGFALTHPSMTQMMDEVYDGYLIPGHRHSDEENYDDLLERSNAALELLASHPGKRICVVTHGLFMRVLLCAALKGREFTGHDLRAAIEGLETYNTGVSHFKYEKMVRGDKMHWRVMSWNDSSHLG